MTAPVKSVIVPNVNRARFLPGRIINILPQAVQDFAIILLDDGSTDESVSMPQTYAEYPKVACLLINRSQYGKRLRGSGLGQWREPPATLSG